MLAILPMLLTLVPDLVKWIAGDTAGTVAQKVSDVVATIAGDTTPAALSSVLADPAKATDLRLALAKVAADAEEAKRKADLDELTARLSDVANARQQTLALAQTGSTIAWGAPVMSVIVTLAFAAVTLLLMWRSLPAGSETMASILFGALSAGFSTVVSYWLGSSAGSARKDQTIAAQAAVPLASGAAQ